MGGERAGHPGRHYVGVTVIGTEEGRAASNGFLQGEQGHGLAQQCKVMRVAGFT